MLFKLLPAAKVRPLLRGTFPYYYLLVIGLSIVATLAASWQSDNVGPVVLLASIAGTTIVARQILMPMINRATDQADKKRFAQLHGLSVIVQLLQIGLSGWAVILLANG